MVAGGKTGKLSSVTGLTNGKNTILPSQYKLGKHNIMCVSWIKCLLPESRHIEIHVQFILQIYNSQNKNSYIFLLMTYSVTGLINDRNTLLLPSKYKLEQQNVMDLCMMYGLVSTRVTQLNVLIFMLWLWVTIININYCITQYFPLGFI